jgi:hypothetical protein
MLDMQLVTSLTFEASEQVLGKAGSDLDLNKAGRR